MPRLIVLAEVVTNPPIEIQNLAAAQTKIGLLGWLAVAVTHAADGKPRLGLPLDAFQVRIVSGPSVDSKQHPQVIWATEAALHGLYYLTLAATDATESTMEYVLALRIFDAPANDSGMAMLRLTVQ